MKKNNILFFFEVCIYLVQIFFMLSFSKYMHSKILYNVFKESSDVETRKELELIKEGIEIN